MDDEQMERLNVCDRMSIVNELKLVNVNLKHLKVGLGFIAGVLLVVIYALGNMS